MSDLSDSATNDGRALGMTVSPHDYADAFLWLLDASGGFNPLIKQQLGPKKMRQRIQQLSGILDQPHPGSAARLAITEHKNLIAKITYTAVGNPHHPPNDFAGKIRHALLAHTSFPAPAVMQPQAELKARRITPAALWISEASTHHLLQQKRVHRIALSVAWLKMRTDYNWSKAGAHLGLPYRLTQSIPVFWHEASLTGYTHEALEFLEELTDRVEELTVPIDYHRRRETFKHPQLLENALYSVTGATTEQAPASTEILDLWAHLTGGHPSYPPSSYQRLLISHRRQGHPNNGAHLSPELAAAVIDALLPAAPCLRDEPATWKPPRE
ncbi:hypothetical protein FHU41_002129 [Psychromicrobium silvestre]|uniref:Uncharacterized protein n=1 Tax=Psychromicrobium silvestre TaxID=1645614 RepID=A0A7Y9LUN2_9MICC|nr:hypothetical protein [Psychromicrobium silvestre]NYE95879.1 hypothetical protein [Psychromicrobium silvestre]